MSNSIYPPPKKTLFIALSGIGNLLMQTPAITRYHTSHPHDDITLWVTPRGTRALAAAIPGVSHVIEAPIKAPLIIHLQTLRTLRQKNFDLAVMLSSGQLWKGAAAMYLAGIPRRVAHTYPFRRNADSRWLLTDAIPENPALHDVDQNLQLLSLLDIHPPTLNTTSYSFAPPPIHKTQAQELLAELRLTGHPQLIAMHAGSAPNFPWKRWPLDRFAAVAEHLIKERHAHILIMGGPDEAELKHQLQKLIIRSFPSTTYNLQPTTSLNTDLLTAAALLQHCQLMISNDSGLMHLAASVGTATLGLFGPTDERLTGPRGRHTDTIRAAGTEPVYNTESNPNLGSRPHFTLEALAPADVINKASDLLTRE